MKLTNEDGKDTLYVTWLENVRLEGTFANVVQLDTRIRELKRQKFCLAMQLEWISRQMQDELLLRKSKTDALQLFQSFLSYYGLEPPERERYKAWHDLALQLLQEGLLDDVSNLVTRVMIDDPSSDYESICRNYLSKNFEVVRMRVVTASSFENLGQQMQRLRYCVLERHMAKGPVVQKEYLQDVVKEVHECIWSVPAMRLKPLMREMYPMPDDSIAPATPSSQEPSQLPFVHQEHYIWNFRYQEQDALSLYNPAAGPTNNCIDIIGALLWRQSVRNAYSSQEGPENRILWLPVHFHKNSTSDLLLRAIQEHASFQQQLERLAGFPTRDVPTGLRDFQQVFVPVCVDDNRWLLAVYRPQDSSLTLYDSKIVANDCKLLVSESLEQFFSMQQGNSNTLLSSLDLNQQPVPPAGIANTSPPPKTQMKLFSTELVKQIISGDSGICTLLAVEQLSAIKSSKRKVTLKIHDKAIAQARADWFRSLSRPYLHIPEALQWRVRKSTTSTLELSSNSSSIPSLAFAQVASDQSAEEFDESFSLTPITHCGADEPSTRIFSSQNPQEFMKFPPIAGLATGAEIGKSKGYDEEVKNQEQEEEDYEEGQVELGNSEDEVACSGNGSDDEEMDPQFSDDVAKMKHQPASPSNVACNQSAVQQDHESAIGSHTSPEPSKIGNSEPAVEAPKRKRSHSVSSPASPSNAEESSQVPCLPRNLDCVPVELVLLGLLAWKAARATHTPGFQQAMDETILALTLQLEVELGELLKGRSSKSGASNPKVAGQRLQRMLERLKSEHVSALIAESPLKRSCRGPLKSGVKIGKNNNTQRVTRVTDVPSLGHDSSTVSASSSKKGKRSSKH